MRALFVGILTLAVTQAAATQESAQAPSSKGVVIKGQAPVATDVLKVKLPRPIEGDLANGLHLMVLEDHRVPLLSFQLPVLREYTYTYIGVALRSLVPITQLWARLASDKPVR